MKRYMTDFDPLKGPASTAPIASPAVDPAPAPDPTLKPPTD